MVSALRSLRCFARVPGIPRSTPIKVEENGWPTVPPLRGYAEQAARLARMARAVHDYRGTFGVTDYRWFNLRDADTASHGAVPAPRAARVRLRRASRRSPCTAAWCAGSAVRVRP